MQPNGTICSYALKPEFVCKAEACTATAAIAVDMGVIDFIKYGSPKAITKCGLVLALLMHLALQKPLAMNTEEDPVVKEIEKCCAEWHASRVKPCWIFLIDSKPTGSEHIPYLCRFVPDHF